MFDEPLERGLDRLDDLIACDARAAAVLAKPACMSYGRRLGACGCKLGAGCVRMTAGWVHVVTAWVHVVAGGGMCSPGEAHTVCIPRARARACCMCPPGEARVEAAKLRGDDHAVPRLPRCTQPPAGIRSGGNVGPWSECGLGASVGWEVVWAGSYFGLGVTLGWELLWARLPEVGTVAISSAQWRGLLPTAAGSTAHGCRHCHTRLQALSHTAAGVVTHGCRRCRTRLQAWSHGCRRGHLPMARSVAPCRSAVIGTG